MYLSIIVLPFLGALSAGLLGRQLGDLGSHIVTITLLTISSFLTLIAFYEVILCGSPVIINLGNWFEIGVLSVDWSFRFDQLSVAMLIPVIWISTLIHLFSTDYMSADPHNPRFFSYLSMFTFFMIVLITGNNYLVMFVGWEGIGISSYLLIGFWFTRLQAVKSALLALTMNRVGDMGISIAFFAILAVFGSLNFATIFSSAGYINESVITLIVLFLFTGTMAKSAQMPLASWLPNSMEGPTPVSALIHAATLVTSGIYLMIRSSHMLEYSPTALLIIAIVGATTLFTAAICGLLQNDLKRIVAFSTISQLGYMVLIIGLSHYDFALLHVIGHACFKALIFLASGSVIHSLVDSDQDIRRMGGLIKFLPLTFSVMMIGTLALIALPFMSGFYSKDIILEIALGSYSWSGTYGYVLGTITAGLTSFYSFRLIILVFFSKPNATVNTYNGAHEANTVVIISLAVLALFSIFFGYIASDMLTGIGNDIFGTSIFVLPNNVAIVEAEFALPLILKLLPTILSIFGAAAAVYLYTFEFDLLVSLTNTKLGRTLYRFINGKALIDIVINQYVIASSLTRALNISKVLDRGIIELIGAFGLSSLLSNVSNTVSNSGAKLGTSIPQYSIFIAAAMVIINLVI